MTISVVITSHTHAHTHHTCQAQCRTICTHAGRLTQSRIQHSSSADCSTARGVDVKSTPGRPFTDRSSVGGGALRSCVAVSLATDTAKRRHTHAHTQHHTHHSRAATRACDTSARATPPPLPRHAMTMTRQHISAHTSTAHTHTRQTCDTAGHRVAMTGLTYCGRGARSTLLATSIASARSSSLRTRRVRHARHKHNAHTPHLASSGSKAPAPRYRSAMLATRLRDISARRWYSPASAAHAVVSRHVTQHMPHSTH
jgi:hypothetical protein